MNRSLTRDEVLDRVRALHLGRQSRERVAKWARKWQYSPDPIGDELLLKMVVYLAAADLPGITKPYLYGPADFGAWESELFWATQGLDRATDVQLVIEG